MEDEQLIQGSVASYWINKNNKVMMSNYPCPVDINDDIKIIIDLGLQRQNIIKEMEK